VPNFLRHILNLLALESTASEAAMSGGHLLMPVLAELTVL
jgi:hypothetical protein